jgi:hypothetical protein
MRNSNELPILALISQLAAWLYLGKAKNKNIFSLLNIGGQKVLRKNQKKPYKNSYPIQL